MSALVTKLRRRPRHPAPTRDEPVVFAPPAPALCGREAARWEARAFPAAGRPVLDLSQVERIDAAGVLAVVRAARRAHDAGRVLCVGGATAPVRMLLASAGLTELAEVHPTRDQAVAAARVG
jgi:anti-anti-sigma regulatory factor